MAESTCDYSIDIDEGPELVLHDGIVLSRKAHKCCECGDPIPVGQKHELCAARWDGEWSSFRTCLPCLAIRKRYCPTGWEYGNLRDHLQECLGFDYTEVPEEDEDE